jgi:acyl dehydratase
MVGFGLTDTMRAMNEPVTDDPTTSKPTVDVGTTYAVRSGRVDPDAAKAYALATNDPNQVYASGRAVPPVYTVSLILPAYVEAGRTTIESGAIEGFTGGVHGEHDIHVVNPVRSGADVQWQVTTHAAKQTTAGVMITHKIAVADEEGTPLVEHYWSTLFLNGRVPNDLGPDLVDHTFPEVARRRPLGSHTFDVTGDQSFRYAGASTDHAMFHVDDEPARRLGFPGKFIQGLCTFAMCSGAVVSLGADGDPDRLRRIAGRFAAPVFPRTQLVVRVYDAGPTEDGGRSLAFEATSQGVTVLKHGRADIRPPSRTPSAASSPAPPSA